MSAAAEAIATISPPTATPVPDPAAERATIPGIDEPLPRGERVLWSGAPDARRLTREAMHVRALAAYFALLALAAVALAPAGAGRLGAALQSALLIVPLGAGVVLFARMLGAMSARTTVYAITDRRIVIKAGIALPMLLNIPLHAVEAAAVREGRDGSGDLTIALGRDVHVAWLLLWPHARPWRVTHPEPMLRALAGVGEVARILESALRAAPARTAA